MMGWHGMTGGGEMMWGMGLFGALLLVLPVLVDRGADQISARLD